MALEQFTSTDLHEIDQTTMILHLLFLPALVAGITISPSRGRYGVSSSTMDLIDHNRLDPYASEPQPRRLMLSIFQPIAPHEPCHPYTTPYMPPATAAAYDEMYSSFGIPNETFASFEMNFCKTPTRQGHRAYPTVIFSPGLGNSRLLYTALATSLSSQGFTVIIVDHPYDASIVEFPDGKIVRAANISSEEQVVEALETRREDVDFVVDYIISEPTIPFFHPRQKIIVAGHSLGGATAAAAMMTNDNRIQAGINLDGSLFDPFISPGIDCPSMLVGRENKTLATDDSWARLWPRLMGTKVEVGVEGFAHGSFTDLPVLVEALGWDVGEELLGSVEGRRGMEIIVELVESFGRFVVGKAREPIDQGMGERYPEVEVLEEVRRGICRSRGFWPW